MTARRGQEFVHIVGFAAQDHLSSRVRARALKTGDYAISNIYDGVIIALYANDGALPADPALLADHLVASVEDVARVLPVLLEIGRSGRGGLHLDGDVVRNRRVTEELAEARAYRAEKRKRGKAGAEKRWHPKQDDVETAGDGDNETGTDAGRHGDASREDAGRHGDASRVNGVPLLSAPNQSQEEERNERAPKGRTAAASAAARSNGSGDSWKDVGGPDAAAEILALAIMRRWPGLRVAGGGKQLARLKSPDAIAVLRWLASPELDEQAKSPEAPLYIPTIQSARSFREKFPKLLASRGRDPRTAASQRAPKPTDDPSWAAGALSTLEQRLALHRAAVPDDDHGRDGFRTLGRNAIERRDPAKLAEVVGDIDKEIAAAAPRARANGSAGQPQIAGAA